MKKLGLLLLLCSAAVFASAAKIDDFQGYAAGKLDDVASPPWDGIAEGTAESTVNAEADGNRYINFKHTTTSSSTPRGFKNTTIGITEGQTKTLFFRVKPFSGAKLDHHIGLADASAVLSGTTNGSDWTCLSSMTTRMGITAGTTAGTAKFAWRAAAGVTVLDNAALNTWYNVWIVYYTATDKADIYVNSGLVNADAPGTGSATSQSFAKTTGTALIQLAAFAYRATGSVGMDDFYIMDGVSLINPVATSMPAMPNPASGATSVAITTAELTWRGSLDPANPAQLDPKVKKYYIYTSEDNASATDPNLTLQQTQIVTGTEPAASYSLGVSPLAYQRTYYWKIEQGMARPDGTAYPAGDPNNISGSVWRFTTAAQTPGNVTGPVSQKLNLNDTAEFIVTFTSASPAGVVWYKGTSPLSGGGKVTITTLDESSTLRVTNVDSNDEGSYYCTITNTGGSVNSATAYLSLKKILAWYRFENNVEDSAGINDGTLGGIAAGMTYTTDQPGTIAGQAYAADPNGGVYVQLSTEAYPKAGFGNGLDEGTVSYWIKMAPDTFGTVLGTYNGAVGSTETKTGIRTRVDNTGKVHFHVRDDLGRQGEPVSATIVDDNNWHFVTAVITKTSVTLYVDVTDKVAANASAAMDNFAAWQYPMVLLANNSRTAIGDLFPGLVDDLRIYNYLKTPEEIAEEFFGVTGKRSCLYPENPGLVYDLNKDCRVNLLDFALFAAEWLQSGLYPN